MKRNFIYTYFILLIVMQPMLAQNQTAWDDTTKKGWPPECKEIAIVSSADGAEQKAMFYAAKKEQNAPLIISLHTWSGDYLQKDPLIKQCIAKGYNYIHPDFRGANNKYDACGSALVLSDIDDAITYALNKSHTDPHNIHVIGVSGGGHATLLAYMKTKHRIKTFSAWVPISDLAVWYEESEGRKNKYGREIAMCTTGKDFGKRAYHINKSEAIKRSPLYMTTPVENRRQSKLFIYTGIHDGYTGSVPITQSIKFYNKVVQDFDGQNSTALVPENDMANMVTSRSFPAKSNKKLGDRNVHYKIQYKDLVTLTVFEGTHEMLSDVALNPAKSLNILTIGDSNGEFDFGWVTQLKSIRFDDFIYNSCISGNTIGYDNLNRPSLNTLKNVDRYLDEAHAYSGKQDAIVIMLGTNDCKAIFTDNIKNVPDSLSKLIRKIKSHEVYKASLPDIFIVSPPPMNPFPELQEKYIKGNDRIQYLKKSFEKTAQTEHCEFIDIYPHLEGVFDYVTLDGIHLTAEGQMIIAKIISETLNAYFGSE